MTNPAPVVGKWYARPGGDSFEIVAFDPDDGTIEIHGPMPAPKLVEPRGGHRPLPHAADQRERRSWK